MKNHVLITFAAVAFVLPATAQASALVDTGVPTGNVNHPLLMGQSLAGYFALSRATTINEIQGYISNFIIDDTVFATLYSDGPLPDAQNTLFSTTFRVLARPPISYDWEGAKNLNWDVAAGNYWLGFNTIGGMTMLNGAPSPLSNYASTSFGMLPGTQNWNARPDLGLGIRVFGNAGAVPEPATWAFLIFGFGAIGCAMRRKAVPTFNYV